MPTRNFAQLMAVMVVRLIGVMETPNTSAWGSKMWVQKLTTQ
jgi:hypothetical protein